LVCVWCVCGGVGGCVVCVGGWVCVVFVSLCVCFCGCVSASTIIFVHYFMNAFSINIPF